MLWHRAVSGLGPLESTVYHPRLREDGEGRIPDKSGVILAGVVQVPSGERGRQSSDSIRRIKPCGASCLSH